jgi:sulfopyruvate decarboxylase TPP-binding subunit
VSAPGAGAALTVEALKKLGMTHALIIPDSESRLLFDRLTSDDDVTVISPTREGESIAIAAGLWTGGACPYVVIQNTGLMEAGDALRGCGLGPRIPLRLIVGWRGYVGAQQGRVPIDSAFTYTEPLLGAWGIPSWHLMSDDDLGALAEMDRAAAATSSPAAVVTGYAFRP